MDTQEIYDLNKKVKLAQKYLTKNFNEFIKKDMNEFVSLYSIFNTSKYSIYFENKVLHDKELIKLKGASLPSDAVCLKTNKAIEIKHCHIIKNKKIDCYVIKGLRLKNNDLYYIYLNNYEKLFEITITKDEFIQNFGEVKVLWIYTTNLEKLMKFKTNEWILK